MGFVLASTATDLIVEGNATSLYDEGVFTINWTAGGDVASNYTVHLYMNDVHVLTTLNANTSTTGYDWSNTTQANYTFTIEAVVAANATGTNSTNVSMYVDSTVPTITLPNYLNTTSKINSEVLTLNITVADALSGITGSFCFIDVNGTSNQTIAVDSGWCNSTVVNLTGSTDGNHTLNVYANDTVGNIGLNNSFVVQVDSTGPTITLPEYTNVTYRKNTDTLTLNISVSDATSGLTGSFCFIDVNGTSNQTIAVDSGWCNSTVVNLTGSTDGNHTLKIYVNDTLNNIKLNDSYAVQVDTTAPSIGLTISSYSTNSLTIAISGVEGACTATGSGTKTILDSTLTVMGLGCGITYPYTVACVDLASNTGTSPSTSFSTAGCGGSSSSTSSLWNATWVVNEDQFTNGFTGELQIKGRMKVSIDYENHYIGLLELTQTTAKIDVSSEPQQATLTIGDSRRFEVTGDNLYDLLVTLNSIENNKANITILSISEEITSATIEEEVIKEDTALEKEEIEYVQDDKTNLTWLWVIIGLVVIVVVLYFFKNKIFKKK